MKQLMMKLMLGLGVLMPALSYGADESTEVVFLRSSMVGKFIKSSIYEINGSETKFIGILGNKKKITHKTTPGKHTYMVVSEAADFMEAELSAGKTYYSIVTPRMGAWKARFSLWPIKNDGTAEYQIGSKDFEKWMKKAKDYVPGEKDFAWYEKHKDSVEEKKNKYWTVWLEKSAEDLAARTLSPADGLTQ
jgi:hypothetical protein